MLCLLMKWGTGVGLSDGRITTAIDRRIYEELHIVVESCVDKCFVLSFFGILLEESWDRCLCLKV